MKLAVIIVNYNVKHFLEQCLKSVYQSISSIEAEVWVVDNNSVDGSVEMVQSLFSEVHIIANKENVGFSVANNQAIKESRSEYVLLLNPDTIVPENCFTKLLTFADSKPDLGGCGVYMVDGQGTYLPESKRGLPTPEVALYKMIGLNKVFPKSKKFGKYHLGYLDKDQNHEIDILSGAFMLMRRRALDEVGLLDETFFMYGEDIDLSYRITQDGWKNYYFADTQIIHYKGESTKKLSTNYVRVFYKAMVIFAEKHYSGGNQKLFKFFINTAIYARATIALTTNGFKKFWQPVLEALFIFISLYWLKGYWEEHIKRGNEIYPIEMVTVHIPYYAASWILSLWYSGSYKKNYDFGLLVRSILLGTAAISIIYGLLPETLRFSRGIILFGTLLVIAMLLIWRTALHFARYKTLDFSQRNHTKSILVGEQNKWEQVIDILKSYNRNYQQIGFVSDQKSDSPQWLGTSSQLKEIIKIYGINEVIFSNDSISTEDTMKLMNDIGSRVNYYTIPADSNFVIGSHGKNTNGLYFGEQIELNLSNQELRTQKRLFDIAMALMVIVLAPLAVVFIKTRNWLLHSGSVLIGKKTWVGYAADPQNLPALKPGIYTTDFELKEENLKFQENLDLLYAKNYSIGMDLRAMLHRQN
ncbi:MAG: glycosyltransferase [Bacteroidia bacterium]|nr:glycosyltransferase [Bacteroidia bacterium]